MHLHILGVAGTFMAGLALIARQLGHEVSGSDKAIYPPMSDLLAASEVTMIDGYQGEDIPPNTDVVVIGNALSRGVDAVEYVLNERISYTSGPEWLRDNVLDRKRVIAVSGTHGKTTTTSMICHVLKSSGIDCGFLVGGIPGNFDISACLGESDWFVIEADEYDTAFFDKRSKFVHYRPEVLVMNNIEFDHADILTTLTPFAVSFITWLEQYRPVALCFTTVRMKTF